MPRPNVFAAALRALDAGRGVAIAAVTGASGSTPRHLGARMAVAADGEQWGTVGGGKIEQLTVEAAKQVAAGGEPRVVRQHLVRDLAMCCGGSMEVAITPAAPSRAVLEQLADASERLVLVTPLDGGALTVRPPREGDPRPHHPVVVDGALVERLGRGERVIVFGLGHVAKTLGPHLAQLGFHVIACDDNETGAAEAAPPWAEQLIESFDAREVEEAVGGFGPDDHVLIITRDHSIDQALLEQLIGHAQLGYLGMIGSRGKIGRFRKRLEAKGLFDETTWRRLRAPIGLDIGAETPEEIAIAIAAELIAHRRRGEAVAGDWSIA
ncbi:MAG: xanthine dehydrogenase accessory protein XdhC [Deltaproteobacteria bacterium]|nr:xanthine dehydrogenase accessory protein XdhC [Deltaproteobacteria bacterium]